MTDAELVAQRHALGLSLRTLADLVGCSNAYLCQLEQGQRTCSPMTRQAIKLALARVRRQQRKLQKEKACDDRS